MKEAAPISWFKALIEHSQQPVVMMDRDGRIKYLNPRFLAITGASSDELIGEKGFSFLAPRSRTEMEKVVRSMQGAKKTERQLELELLDKHGDAIRLTWRVLALPDEQGNAAAIGLIGDALVKRKNSNGAFDPRNSLLNSILDNAIDGTITIDERGSLISFNKAAEQLFGYRAEEILGRNVKLLMPSPYHEEHDQYIRNYLTTGAAKIIGKGREVLGLRKNGTTFPFFLKVGRELQFDDGRRGFVGVIRDLSMEKQVENQLRRSQRMEGIGTLAGGIAHDFNNILGGIMGYVELMLEDAEEGGRLHEDLTEMLRACKRGRELVLQILTFSRQEKPSREPMFLHPVIKECLKLLRASIPTTIEIQQHIETDGPTIIADPTQIHQVMMNLGANAFHAMRESGGQLTVSLKTVEIDENFHEVSHNLPFGAYQHLIVKDTGVGMDEKTLARIYDPFFTTKPAGEGTGMGLSVVLGIMQGHEGDIIAQSKPGVGSEFHLLFPVKGGLPQPVAPELEKAGRGQARVLLVDDDLLLLRVQARILEKLGYRVTTKADGTSGLENVRQQPHGFDLVITDQTMPGMTGLEMIEAIRAFRPELPVILTTGSRDAISHERAELLKIRAILVKPVSKNELAQAIQHAMAHPDGNGRPR